MDYKHAAQQILDCIGGKGNIVSAAHCATRLRLVIADNAKVNKQELENAEGAKGVFEAQGQLQIIFGTGTVNKVYDEFIQLAGIEGGSKEDVKQAAAAKAPWYQRAIKTLGDIFVPIMPRHRGFRLPDGHHGSAELHGEQRFPEHRHHRLGVCVRQAVL